MAYLALRSAILETANATDVGSIEPSTELFNDRISLITATTLVGAFQGITTVLYCMTTYALLKKLFQRSSRSGVRTGRRRTLFYIAYTSILFVLVTIYTAGNSQNAIVAYVDNRLYPGGPYAYYVAFMTSQGVMIMTDIAALIILWMTDALIIFRFVLFYYQVPYIKWIIPLPCAMYVGVAVLSALLLQGEAKLGKIFFLSENLILGYYALSFSLNVLCTLLIAARLYQHKVQLERVFGPETGSPYMSIATLLIESASLYATWSILFLVLCVLGNPAQIFVLGTMSQIQVIAPLLIILWTARGNTWSNDTTYRGGGESTGDGSTKSVNGRGSGGVSLSIHPFVRTIPQRASSKLSTPGIDRSRESQNGSLTTVISGGGNKAKHDGDNGGTDGDVIELELYGSKSSGITMQQQ